MTTENTTNSREIDYATEVRKVLGKEYKKPEVVYEFSNGRKVLLYRRNRERHLQAGLIMPITGWHSSDPANETMAKSALEVLHKNYPMHPWHVRIDGGCLIIFNSDIDARFGMVRHISKISSDYTTFSKDIVVAAGELLERAKLRRGVSDGVDAKTVDGIAIHKRRVPGGIIVQ